MTIKERNKEHFVSYSYERVILKSLLLIFLHAWFNRKNRSKGKGEKKVVVGNPLVSQQPKLWSKAKRQELPKARDETNAYSRSLQDEKLDEDN